MSIPCEESKEHHLLSLHAIHTHVCRGACLHVGGAVGALLSSSREPQGVPTRPAPRAADRSLGQKASVPQRRRGLGGAGLRTFRVLRAAAWDPSPYSELQ